MTALGKVLIAPLMAALLLTGCVGFTMEDIMADLPVDEEADLSADPDPEVQAAAAANREILDEENARFAMDHAIESNELDSALMAVELRPMDPLYHLKFGALLLANDDGANARGEYEAAGAIMQHEEYSLSRRLELALNATLEVRESFDPESDAWARLNTDYCRGLSKYRELVPEETAGVFDNVFGAVTFPDDTCDE